MAGPVVGIEPASMLSIATIARASTHMAESSAGVVPWGRCRREPPTSAVGQDRREKGGVMRRPRCHAP